MEKEPTRQIQYRFSRWFSPENILLGCLLVLPYFSYLALGGLVLFLFWSIKHRPRALGSLLYSQGWLWLSLGLVFNVLMSYAPGESALQVLNFIPFFALYAAIVLAITNFQEPLRVLHRWALGLVLASLPISLRSAVEFYFNAPTSIERWQGSPWLDWLYLQPSYGHRADSVFGHPNVLANYLVIILGLGLGLIMYYLRHHKRAPELPWLYGAVFLVLIGIFCSGSRNGLLIAGFLLLIFGWYMRRNRFIALTGLGALTAMFLGVLAWGVGDRSLLEAFQAATLRVDLWQISSEMIDDHPWIGIGLGTFKFQYVPYSVPDYKYIAHPHNLVLMFASELGIPVAILFLSIVGLIVFRGVKALLAGSASDPTRLILAPYYLGFAGIMGFAMFDLTFYDSRVNVLGWLMLAVIQSTTALAPASVNPGPKSTLPFADQSKDPTPSQP